MDFDVFSGADNAAWYGRAEASGAQLVRLTAHWSQIATARPANPSDPSDPAYDWSSLDRAVEGANVQGLRVLITFQSAPRWAEGAHRPKSALPGSWKPDVPALRAFAQALASRYDGAHGLPRVRDFQVWNEPNLPRYLSPQWRGPRSHRRADSPGRYRRMLNAAYAAIKSVHGDNRVAAAGTAPYGDFPSANNRMMPVPFLRTLLSRRTHLDAIDHHPYATGSPSQHSVLSGNAAIPDLHRLTAVLAEARRKHHVLPRGHTGVWVTEVSWDSRPPDPDGVPEGKRSRWLQDTLYTLWKQGADTICWFLLRDQPPVPSYDMTYQSGLYFVDGRAKRSARAFRLPLVLHRHGSRVSVWGHAPSRAPVTIERRSGGQWRAAKTVRPARGGILQTRVAGARGTALRLRQGEAIGLTRRAP